jgi:hypothetical protein
MTREEAIRRVKGYLTDCLPSDCYEEVEEIIKALEQEPILDKIYADIQKLRGCSCSCSDGIIDDVEDILDKHKAEIEEE